MTSSNADSVQQTARKSSGIAKPARNVPSHSRVKAFLKSCLKKKTFKNVRQVIHLFQSDKVQPDVTCYKLIISILQIENLTDLKQEFEQRLANLERQLLSLRNESTDAVPSTPIKIEQQGPAPMDIDKPSQRDRDTDEDEEDDDDDEPVSSEYLDKLNAIISEPSGIHEVLINPCQRNMWRVSINNEKNTLSVTLRLRLNFLSRELSHLTKDIRATGESRFSQTDSTAEGGKVHVCASNLASKNCLDRLDAIIPDIKRKARQILERSLAKLFESWKNENFKQAYVMGFQRAKHLVLSESIGGLYGSKVVMYGSSTTGLFLPGSDVDIAVILPKEVSEDKEGERGPQAWKKTEVLAFLMKCAVSAKMREPELIASARIPVLRYRDPKAHVDVDITLGGNDPTLMSRFIRRHLQVDSRIWELCMAVKHWARCRRVCGTLEGYINAIGWTIMVIFFLQHVCTPPIACLFCTKGRKEMRHRIVRVGWKSGRKRGKCSESTAALLTRFFQYFGCEFEFDKMAISLNCQDLSEARELRTDGNCAVFIEQPLEFGANVVGQVSSKSLGQTCSEMRKAYWDCVTRGEGLKIFEEVDEEERGNDWMFA